MEEDLIRFLIILLILITIYSCNNYEHLKILLFEKCFACHIQNTPSYPIAQAYPIDNLDINNNENLISIV